jgi:NADH-quinone oxidoreductase subunit C
VADETVIEATADPVAPDALRQPMLDLLQGDLGGNLLGFELNAGDDLCIRVDRSVWRHTVELCRDRLGLSYFCFLSGIDWQQNPSLLGEKAWEAEEAVIEATEGAIEEDAGDDDAAGVDAAAAEDAAAEEAMGEAILAEDGPPALRTGVAGGDSRFQVFARLYNVTTHVGLTLKADLDDADPRIDSLVPLYRGADWHEREAWEMYGFVFDGHPGLRHLYLPSEFEGYPLRKDFPLLARIVKPWPGLVNVEGMPGEEADADSDPLAGVDGA